MLAKTLPDRASRTTIRPALRIHSSDTVAVALRDLTAGETVEGVTLAEPIPHGHKFALHPIANGARVLKFGEVIGAATQDIAPGQHVHTYNLRTRLRESEDYAFTPMPSRARPKQGSASGVLDYAQVVRMPGLSLLRGPGNDAVSATNLVASGATVVLFTTGRGTPLGFPVPTLKVSSNSDLAARKANWIDFDAGVLTSTEDRAAVTDDFMAHILAVASGEARARNELNDQREIAIWKTGVTL